MGRRQLLNVRAIDLARSSHTFANDMINVTDNAVRQLKTLLKSKGEEPGQGLRVQIAKGGCSGLQYEMTLDEEHAGDEVIEREGVRFLVDTESAPYLEAATLDFRDGLTSAGFQIVNPNAARTCGCGTSFEAARPA
jgi:iron-sulfur cluster assembly protein